jgi:hypothetical protein
MGTLAPRALELGALAPQPPLELGAVHGLSVHINVYHVKRLRHLRRGDWPSRQMPSARGTNSEDFPLGL